MPVFCKVPAPVTKPEAFTFPEPPIMAEVLNVRVPYAFANVPLLLISDPEMVNGSPMVKPFRSTIAPAAMVVATADPRAALLPIFSVPTLTVVAPEYVFAPVKVQVPAPDLVRVPELEITPERVAFPEPPMIAAVVRVIAPEAVAAVPLLFTNVPLLVNGSAVVKPFKSTVPPEEIVVIPVVAVVVPSAALLPNFNVPALTVVTPVNVFVPDKVQVPLPDFANVPEPLRIPDAVASPVPARIAAVVRVILADTTAAVLLLLTNEPLRVKGSAMVNPFKSRIPPEEMVVAAVVPSPKLLPTLSVPAVTVVTEE